MKTKNELINQVIEKSIEMLWGVYRSYEIDYIEHTLQGNEQSLKHAKSRMNDQMHEIMALQNVLYYFQDESFLLRTAQILGVSKE
jgi:hypothetical protein